MTSLKRPPMERTVGGTIPATDEFYTRHLRMVNGGGVPTRTDNVHATVSTGVPKMGVRARVADWPPRKDITGALWHSSTEPENSGVPSAGKSHIKLGSILSPQDSSMLRNIHNTLKNRTQAQANNYSPDTRYLAPGDYRGPAHRNPRQRRIRQRSNSDMTISEMEGSGDSGEDWGPSSAAKWSPLHREYGSTSSIDQHGASGESFFEMLKVYQGDKVDQRSPAPEKLEDMLNVGPQQAIIDLQEDADSQPPKTKDRDKPPKRRTKSETGGESIFRKLRNVRGELDSPRAGSDAEDSRTEDTGPPLKPWVCQRGFAHYDVQSMLFDLNEITQLRQTAGKRKNTTTGASAAAVASATSTLSSTHSLPYSSPSSSQEELSSRDSPSLEAGDEQSNEMLLSCPCFRNEIGADGNGSNSGSGTLSGEGNLYETSVSTHCTNAGVAVLEGPKEGPSTLSEKGKQYIVEHVDLGAYYYRKFFYLREHWNYFGIDEALGPVAVSLRREKLEEDKEHGQQYNYRLIFRTSEVSHSVLSCLHPSLNLMLSQICEIILLDLSCLRLALNTPKVTEHFQVKVGVMYCRAGQSTEEEMYNNETAGPALEEFLQLLGEKVRLKGFTKYRAQLDTKTDSTGTHSLYTSYKDYEIMFHVSTLLPYTPNNKQQLLRKRHIGNDIVTIVFQEPGAHPFTPKAIRSHFQHVFIIVRVHNPCSDNTCYSVAVTRSQDVPSFGPPIPKGVTFPKSTVFRDFLLAKVINAENAAHKSDKFGAMATRTRQEYLRDLAERHVTSTPVEPTGKFPFISLAHKRREKVRPYSGAELRSLGAVTWQVHAEDQVAGAERECLLAISNDFIILLDQEAKAVVFNCATRDVIGWSTGSPASMKIYYERGESVSLRSINNNTEDFGEVVKRLEVSGGSQTTEMTLRRNALGQLGFHVNFEGIVAEVEPYGYAWQAGLRQGSRLVEICKVAVASLSHEQMIDLLRTSVTVKVVIIPPHEDSTPRRGCSEIYHMPLVDYKNHKEGMPYELKFPFRPTNNNTKWPRTSSSPQTRAAGTGGTLIKAPPSDFSDRNSAAIPRSVSSDGRPLNPKSQSSSNTLSSNASSSAHSDDKWYEVGSRSGVRSDLELNGYLQGCLHRYDTSAHVFYNCMNINVSDAFPYPYTCLASSTLSSGHSGSPMGQGCSPVSLQDETAAAATSPTSQNSQSPGTKSFYPRQGATSKYLIGWRKPGGTVNSVDFGSTRKRHQSDGLLGGQPQLRANLRGAQSPQRHTAKSSLEEDLKKLITLDSPPPTTSEEKVLRKPLFPGPPPSRRSLQRTLSDESIYSGQREPSSSGQRDTPTDLLFSCSTMPRSPTTRQGPSRRASHKSLGDLSAPESSELEQEKRQQLQDPVLMPLPDTGADGPLDWAHLVDAAKAFEGRHTLFSFPPRISLEVKGNYLYYFAVKGGTPACLMGKVSQLESMVKVLQEDLKKEKDAKASLQAQIQSLREDNQRLLEESYSASAKLKKFTEWVFNTIDMN
uniref:Signal induced proliferation associated 1 like 1 n=1 Tax=Lates calcarifer TaxID=8187 RepID=A0A4W6ETR9_LATCA